MSDAVVSDAVVSGAAVVGAVVVGAWAGTSSSCAIARISSRMRSIVVSRSASTFRRSSGSVWEERSENHQRSSSASSSPQCSTVSPSRSSVRAAGRVAAWARTLSRAAAASSTRELISPLPAYGSCAETSAEAGPSVSSRALSTCRAASMPESAK